eukprot:6615942-Prymnesium_polylepis.1
MAVRIGSRTLARHVQGLGLAEDLEISMTLASFEQPPHPPPKSIAASLPAPRLAAPMASVTLRGAGASEAGRRRLSETGVPALVEL